MAGRNLRRIEIPLMKVLDPGHRYALAGLDGPGPEAELQFVKRIGPGYPGNEGPPFPGTTIQEVVRALIDRCRYLNRHIPCVETEAAIGNLLTVLVLLEIRAKRVKGKHLEAMTFDQIEAGPICLQCAHVLCTENHRGEPMASEEVNHPDHYGGAGNPYEAIRVIEAWNLGFCLGNAVKYIARAGRKGDRLTDLRKARWYLDREIENLEKSRG